MLLEGDEDSFCEQGVILTKKLRIKPPLIFYWPATVVPAYFIRTASSTEGEEETKLLLFQGSGQRPAGRHFLLNGNFDLTELIFLQFFQLLLYVGIFHTKFQ